MRISLIDVDGHNFPNLPLMKLSAWHKQNGDQVEWYDPLTAWLNPDEQLEMIYTKDLERKENSMDNTYAPTENKEQEKIKVESIDTIVTVRGDRPYYENMYREVGDNYYHIGYSSYRLDVALEYREKYFELVERESDWIPCNERMPKGTVLCCDDRGNMLVGLPCEDEAGYMAYGDDGQEMYNCVAWMPLPEPYKQNDEGAERRYDV